MNRIRYAPALLLLVLACDHHLEPPVPPVLPTAATADAAAIQADSASDRAALVALWEALDGPNWGGAGQNWMTTAPLGRWYGVDTDSAGRVTHLYLDAREKCNGTVPPEIGNLTALRDLRFWYCQLGELPPEIGNLTALERFRIDGSDLTTLPPEFGNLTALEWLWVRNNALTELPREIGNLTALEELRLLEPYLTELPPEIGSLTALEELHLYWSALTELPPEIGNLPLEWGELVYNRALTELPPEFGNLAGLRTLDLSNNALTELPPEFGNLAGLRTLDLSNNALTELPPEFGNLAGLKRLDLRDNALTELPPEIGNLTALPILLLGGNDLDGLPPEFGNLSALEVLTLSNNYLRELPPEIGTLPALESLYLDANYLTGPIPPEIANLANLKNLDLRNNYLTGPIPPELVDLTRLESLRLRHNYLACVDPKHTDLLQWLAKLEAWHPGKCEVPHEAVLVQATQSRKWPVPLVAGRDALLRVFLSSSTVVGETAPAARATFFHGEAVIHTVDIPTQAGVAIPPTIIDGALHTSANALIPADVLRPGLEMVVELDSIHPSIPRRIPTTGRQAVDVREVPRFKLTLLPFLLESDTLSARRIAEKVTAMANNPDDEDRATLLTLLPIGEHDIIEHAPILVSEREAFAHLSATEAARRIEGGGGYWMGIGLGGFDATGVANFPGWTSYSTPDAATMTHELGHNMGLPHAPCGSPKWTDNNYPYPGGQVGPGGYSHVLGSTIRKSAYDVMSYCHPVWISGYNFSKALSHRLEWETKSARGAAADAAPKTRTLLLWGGVDSTGTAAHLDPAFLVDAVPSMPDADGEWSLDGRTEDGREAFRLSFDMPEIADAPGERSAFVFTVPVTWTGELESIRLHGPGDAYAVLDRTTDNPMTILRDPVSGQVRAFLRRPMAEAMAAGDRSDGGRSGLVALFSRGLPR